MDARHFVVAIGKANVLLFEGVNLDTKSCSLIVAFENPSSVKLIYCVLQLAGTCAKLLHIQSGWTSKRCIMYLLPMAAEIGFNTVEQETTRWLSI